MPDPLRCTSMCTVASTARRRSVNLQVLNYFRTAQTLLAYPAALLGPCAWTTRQVTYVTSFRHSDALMLPAEEHVVVTERLVWERVGQCDDHHAGRLIIGVDRCGRGCSMRPT